MKNKKIWKVLILIILIVVMVFLIYFIYQKFQEYRFKKLLQDNDAFNYELTEIVNGVETKVYVRDKVLFSETGNSKVWMSELESKRVIFDDTYKTAILDENDENIKVNSLNNTYIHDYFENSNQSFQYLGKENGYYKIQFKEKGSNKMTLLYMNEKTNLIEKMVQNANNFEFVTEFKVEKNNVAKEEIAYPNLEGYRASDSVNSKPTE